MKQIWREIGKRIFHFSLFPFPLLSFQKGNRKGKKTEKREKREKKKETKKGLVIPQLISGITSHHKKIGVNCTCQRNYAALLGAILSQKIEPWTVIFPKSSVLCFPTPKCFLK
jgi:hypothetical protein